MAGGEGDNRGWDGWMASPTQWTWVWVNSRSWWWTGKPGMLQSMGLQRVGHNWVTEQQRWSPPFCRSPRWVTPCSPFCDQHRDGIGPGEIIPWFLCGLQEKDSVPVLDSQGWDIGNLPLIGVVRHWTLPQGGERMTMYITRELYWPMEGLMLRDKGREFRILTASELESLGFWTQHQTSHWKRVNKFQVLLKWLWNVPGTCYWNSVEQSSTLQWQLSLWI